MEQINNTVDQINEYFSALNGESPNEKDMFSELFAELTLVHKTVSHKEIITGLIHKLETERDVVRADIYRNMLEIMLRSANDQ
ncbi:biofilm development regulator YmgB/AriR family protein [Rahnella aquatilis]|uniref:biofilm development regulator YmgB/AriR family protein n=1 Tax=Rahnella aquatilis TaxID=34038 RepID=UPI0036648780